MLNLGPNPGIFFSGEVGLVEFVDHGLHPGMDGRIARQIGGKPVGKLHHESSGGAVIKLGAVRVESIPLRLRQQGGGALFTCAA